MGLGTLCYAVTRVHVSALCFCLHFMQQLFYWNETQRDIPTNLCFTQYLMLICIKHQHVNIIMTDSRTQSIVV